MPQKEFMNLMNQQFSESEIIIEDLEKTLKTLTSPNYDNY